MSFWNLVSVQNKPVINRPEFIGAATGGHDPPKILENIVLLWFERRFSKQNSVIRLKSNILAPQIFGLATPLPDFGEQRQIFMHR